MHGDDPRGHDLRQYGVTGVTWVIRSQRRNTALG
jgi:hypothetical protein